MAVLILLTSCQPDVVASAAVVSQAETTATVSEPTTTPMPTNTATSVLPTATAVPMPSTPTTIPTSMPSFSAVDPAALEESQEATMAEETATSASSGQATSASSGQATSASSGQATSASSGQAVSNPTIAPPEVTETATPIPTFTPPALPFTSDEEHYWLKRPIPEGGTVWTDKVYPYGGTKGGDLRPHHGVEFYVEKGTEVIASASGTVIVDGNDSVIAYGPHTDFYGNLVVIELDTPFEGQPVYNLYAHLSNIYVSEGQHVEAEELIALSGASGVADGPHLHLEVRLGQNNYGNTYNPRLWLYPFPDYGTVAGRVVRKNGTLVEEAPISLNRIDADSRYLATSSYAGTTVNSDAQWHENFALDDVPMGYYEVTVAVGKKKFTEEIYVFPYRTNFVEIVIED